MIKPLKYCPFCKWDLLLYKSKTYGTIYSECNCKHQYYQEIKNNEVNYTRFYFNSNLINILYNKKNIFIFNTKNLSSLTIPLFKINWDNIELFLNKLKSIILLG
jgi:hypothetical protein